MVLLAVDYGELRRESSAVADSNPLQECGCLFAAEYAEGKEHETLVSHKLGHSVEIGVRERTEN
jgi:hypothetical protein